METHATSMISWPKAPKPCYSFGFADVDRAKPAEMLKLRLSLQLLIFSCCALEKISLFPIM